MFKFVAMNRKILLTILIIVALLIIGVGAIFISIGGSTNKDFLSTDASLTDKTLLLDNVDGFTIGKGASAGEKAVFYCKRGETNFKKGDEYNAMEDFLEAEKWSIEIKNDLLKGRIYWFKGELYSNRLDYINAINMYTLSAEYYLKAGRKNDLMLVYRKMALSQSKTKNFEEAIVYFQKAKSLATELRDKLLKDNNRRGIADSASIEKLLDYEKLIMNFSTAISGEYFNKQSSSVQTLEELKATYDKYNGGKEDKEDYFLLACIYLDANDVKKARDYVAKYKEWKLRETKNAQIGVEFAGLLSLQSEIEKKAGNYKEALFYREKYNSVLDSIEFVERTKSIREAENSYWQRELLKENNNVKLQNSYLIVIYILVLSLCIGGIAVLWSAYVRRLKQKNAQIEEYVEALNILDKRVSIAESSKNNILSQLDIHIEREKMLKDLLESRFSEVRELIRTYYEYGNSKKLQKKVDDLLKLQLSGDNFAVIEDVVNAKNNNVIKRVREKYPSLKEENIKLLNLIYAGFSAQEISVILNDTPQNIYVRKSRLKKTILDLISTDEQMNFN